MSSDDSKYSGSDQPIIEIDFEQVEQVSQVFYEESEEILEELDDLILRLEEDPNDMDSVNVLFRRVHTLKGSVGAVPGGQLLGSVAHEFEALLERIKKEQRAATKESIDLFLQSSRILKVLALSLREKRELFPEELSESIELITRYGNFQFKTEGVSSGPKTAKHKGEQRQEEEGVWLSMKQVNEMLRISGELMVLKNFFQMMNQTVNYRSEPDLYERRQGDFAQNLTKICDLFHTQMQSVRKEKAEVCFHGLPVLVRQTATELNKTVQLETQGMDLLIDKSLGSDLYESLVHMVRNSIDHGLEDPFERAVQGKPSLGCIRIEISEEGGYIHLRYQDDGKGLSRDSILAKAIKNGLVSQEQSLVLSDEEIYRFILQPGFSTKEKVTTMSGRGVGMDVVLSTVEKYGGRIRIHTELGANTCFHLEVPIPQHILVEQALLCQWSGFQFSIPLKAVSQITACSGLQLTHVDHLRFCQYDGHTIPLMNYQEVLTGKLAASEEQVRMGSVIIIRTREASLGLLVDQVDGQSDIVVKPFGNIVKDVKGCKGLSILANEKVTYVVDPDRLLALIGQASAEERAAA